MILARIDLYAERWELAKLVAAIFQPALLLALAFGLMLASAHLITMLGTRWGRRRVSQKALVFSIVVHFSLVCGILALWPEAVPGSAHAFQWKPKPTRPPPEAFNVVTVPDTELARSDVNDSHAREIWNQLPDDLTQEPERTAPQPVEFTEPPELRPSALETPETEIAVTTPVPSPELELPNAVDLAPPPPQTAPVESLPLDAAPVPTAREDVELPSAPRERSAPARDSLPDSSLAQAAQRPEAAPIERVAPLPLLDRPPTSVAGAFDEQAALRDVDEGIEIVRPEGPAPAELPTPDAAPAVASNSAPAAEEAPLRPAISQGRTMVTRSTRPDETGDVERVRPEIARTESPRREPSIVGPSALTSNEVPAIERPQIGLPAATGEASVPAPYRLRATEERKAATREFGGTAESERAVELSLQWLADNQAGDGYWDASAHGAGSTRIEGKDRWEGVGSEADTGVTGLALLAFLGPIESLGDGDYTENIERALRWLVSQQRADGGMGGRAGATDYAYCHAMATFALAEAYALSKSAEDEWLRESVERAIRYTLDSMTTDGGWRYQKGNTEGDMSVFGWQLMALKSAELGGIDVPKSAQDKMVRFLIARSLGANGGLAGYRPRERPTASMTAEALYCKQRLGISRDNPACEEAVGFLLKSLPQRSEMNFYYWYYGSLAMRQYGGDEWTQWNERLRDLLIQDQIQSGALAGSWDPNDQWGRYGGRIYSTALATLCLEVYYRYGAVE